jgi:hypothetical protein
MNRLAQFVAPILILGCRAVAAQACSEALVPDMSLVRNDIGVKLAYLSTIDQNNFPQKRQDFSNDANIAIEGIPLGGFATFSEFDQARAKYFSQYNYTADARDAGSFISTKVSPAAFKAYADCLTQQAAQRPGLHIIPLTVSDDSLVLSVRWSPPAGVADPVTVQYQFSNVPNEAAVREALGTSIASQSSVAAILSRNPNQDLRVLAIGGGYVEHFRVARTPPPVAPLDCTQPRRSSALEGLTQELRGDDCERVVYFLGRASAERDCDTPELNWEVALTPGQGSPQVLKTCGEQDFDSADLVCEGEYVLPKNSVATLTFRQRDAHCTAGESGIFTVMY